MKGNKKISFCVACPYYKYHSQNAIYCQPPAEASNFITSFENSDNKKAYMKKYCYPIKARTRCLLYDVLSRAG